MTTITTNNAANREEAIILLEEGRKQFANGDYTNARASFKEAIGLDPANRQIWLCLASVSTGTEQADCLKRANPRFNQPSAAKGGTRPSHTAVSRRVSPVVWYSILGALLLIGISTVVIWRFAFSQLQSQTLPASDLDYAVISATSGGKLNLQGKVGLYIPAGSLQKDEQFQISFPTDAPDLPEKNLYTAIGKAVKVDTTATILRQLVTVGIRYDASQLPKNTLEKSLQVARWDGNAWEIVDRTVDTDQKIIYIYVSHFSTPLFRVIALQAPAASSAMAQKVQAANDVFFQNETGGSAAALYEKIVSQITSAAQFNGLSAADQQDFWMSYNLWGDALYKAGRYNEAGDVYLNCIKIAQATGVKVSTDNQLLWGPGYALDALQNRFPLGINLTKILRAEGWTATMPPDLLTHSTQSFVWRFDTAIQLGELPPALAKSILNYESTLGRQSTDPAVTSLDLMVLSAQAQAQSEVENTVQRLISPFLQSSGIPEITSANLKETAPGLVSPVRSLLLQNQASNRYMIDPVQSGEGLHASSPLVLLRVERAWENETGTMTHVQHVFTIQLSGSKVGDPVGDVIGADTTYQVVNAAIESSDVNYQWSKIGATLTKDIRTVRTYDDKSLAVGAAHVCALTKLNGVECWGQNQSGQLGVGDVNDRLVPVDVKGLASGFSQIVAGESHTCALSKDGKIMCWGSNSSGQVGNGSKNNQVGPVVISGIDGTIASISAGALHTCALTKEGKVYCWGSNLFGQLGTGNTNQSLVPVPVLSLNGVQMLAAGGSHTCALQKNGSVMCWGANSNGQLGNNTRTNSSIPVNVSELTGSTGITAGQEHTCAITSTGGVKCWGMNTAGQLGSGSSDTLSAVPMDVRLIQSNVISIKSLKHHTCAIADTGVFCWGMNTSGQLGNIDNKNQSVPVALNLTESQFASVGTGSDFSCARTENGFVYCWGANGNGRLGNRSTVPSPSPVAVSGFGTLVADAEGKIEISPMTEDSIELGTTINIRPINVPNGAISITYQLSYDNQPFMEIGKTAGNDKVGVSWTSAGKELNKKVVVRSVVEDSAGINNEAKSRELTIRDTIKPTASITVTPNSKTIELGDTVTFVAHDPKDIYNGITGSGVERIVFSVLENGAEIGGAQTVMYAPNKIISVTWPAPTEPRKNHDTLLTFRILVIDNAGNEYRVDDSGYTLADHLKPNFIGSLQVKSDLKLTGDGIEMGSKVTIIADVSDIFQNTNKEGSGISDASFYVSTDGGGSYKPLGPKQTPRDAPGKTTIISIPWDSGNPKILSGTKIRFLARVTDVAGNTAEKSADYKIVDTTMPTARSLKLITSPDNLSLHIQVSGISDGLGIGASKGQVKVRWCDGKEFDNSLIEFDIPSQQTEIDKSTGEKYFPLPTETCGYGKTVSATLVLLDGTNTNESAASATATYLYDVTAPEISGIEVSDPVMINGSSSKTVTVKVNLDNAKEIGGSEVTVTLSAVCKGSPDGTIGAPKALAVNGTLKPYEFNWTPADSSAVCPWETSSSSIVLTATAKDKNNPEVSKLKSLHNKVDITLPFLNLSVNGEDKTAAQSSININTPLTIGIEAKDDTHPGGSGIASVSGTMNNGSIISSNNSTYKGPFSCGNIPFHFSVTDNNGNVGVLDKVVNYTFSSLQIGNPPTDFIAGKSITSYNSIELKASVKQVCNGIKKANFVFLNGTKTLLTIPSQSVNFNSATGEVTITASHSLTRQERIDLSENSSFTITLREAVSLNDAPIDGSVTENGYSVNIPNLTIQEGAFISVITDEDTPLTKDLTTNSTEQGSTVERWEISSVATSGTAAVNAMSGRVTYTPASNYSNTADNPVKFTVLATNNMGDTAQTEFSVVIRPVNDDPTITAIDQINITAAENDGTTVKTVNLSGVTAGGEETQPLKVTASAINKNSGTPLIGTVTVNYSSPQATGSLSFTPANNLSVEETDTITITVTDGGFDNDLLTTGDNRSKSIDFDVVIAATSGKAFTEFKFILTSVDYTGSINETSHTINVIVPPGTDRTNLVATFTTSAGAVVKIGNKTQISGGTANNFTTSKTYTVMAANGTSQDYTVTVPSPDRSITVFKFAALNPDVVGVINQTNQTINLIVPAGTDRTNLVATFTVSTGATVKIASAAQASGITVNDFTSARTYTVTAENGTTQDYTVTVPSPEKTITDFKFAALNPEVDGVINPTNHTINLIVPEGTNLSNLVATFTVSAGASVKIASTPQITGVTTNDFTTAKTYTVIAANGATQDYTVTVPSPERTFTDFRFASLSPDVVGTIDSANHTINLVVPAGTDLTNLVATFTVSAGTSVKIASAPQISGLTANNFTSAKTYTLTATNGALQDYKVTVTLGP